MRAASGRGEGPAAHCPGPRLRRGRGPRTGEGARGLETGFGVGRAGSGRGPRWGRVGAGSGRPLAPLLRSSSPSRLPPLPAALPAPWGPRAGGWGRAGAGDRAAARGGGASSGWEAAGRSAAWSERSQRFEGPADAPGAQEGGGFAGGVGGRVSGTPCLLFRSVWMGWSKWFGFQLTKTVRLVSVQGVWQFI